MRASGSRGARFGLLVEREFAHRCNGRCVSDLKTDVLDADGVGHSVKSTRRARGARLLAKSYNCIPDEWSVLKRYTAARESGDTGAECVACYELVSLLKDHIRARDLWKTVITGGEPCLTRLTVYDNRGEREPEDLSAPFRSYHIPDVIRVLTTDVVWTVRTRKRISLAGHVPWFTSKAVSVALGSAKRRLLLFTLENVQKLLDAAESAGKLKRVDTY